MRRMQAKKWLFVFDWTIYHVCDMMIVYRSMFVQYSLLYLTHAWRDFSYMLLFSYMFSIEFRISIHLGKENDKSKEKQCATSCALSHWTCFSFSSYMYYSFDLVNELLQDDELVVEPWSTMTLRRKYGHRFFFFS